MGLHHAHGTQAGPERLRSVRAALLVAVVLFVAKLGGFLATGLIVLLAESLHSLTDALQTAFLLVAARLSASPPDEAHPYGHGRGENLAAVMVSMIIVAFIAAELVREAFDGLVHPRPAPVNPELAAAVLVVSGALILWPLVLARRDMDEHGGVVRAQATESLNDLLGVGAGLAGIVGVVLGVPAADPIAALIVAGVIAYTAVGLFRANMPYLMGGSPPQEFYREVAATAQEVSGVLGVHSLAAEYIGPRQVHLDMSLTVPADMSIDDADELAHRVRHHLGETMHVESISIHFCSARGALRGLPGDQPGNGPTGPAKLSPAERRGSGS